jgi:hypothetical protein
MALSPLGEKDPLLGPAKTFVSPPRLPDLAGSVLMGLYQMGLYQFD